MMVDQKIYRGSMEGGLIQIKQLGFEPKTVIDVGAALGTFCLYEIFPNSRHILIEPIRENEPYLAKICKNLNNAEYLIAAATKELGLFTINVDPNLVHSSVSDLVSSSEENFYRRTIDGITLDWICEEKELEPPYLIKVDVDGSETDVMAGATRMLWETEYVIVEVGLFTQIFNVIECMKAQGFVIYDIVNLSWRPLDNALWQCDMVFVKESGRFRKNKTYIKKEQTELMTASLKNYRENLIAYIEDRYSEAHALCKQATIFYNKGQFKEAIATSKQAIEMKPNLTTAYLTMGNALQILGNFDEAIASYSQALEIQPDLAAVHASLGSIYFKQGKLDDAKSSCEEAIALDPELATAYWNLGHALNEENKLEEALPCWQKALELKPNLVGPEFHRDLGNVLGERGKLDEVIASYQKALELQLDDPKIYQNLGNILAQKGKLDEAINYYIQALKIKPNSKNTYISLGQILRKKGRLDEANTCFTVCLSTNVLVEFDRTNANWSINSTLDHPLVEIINLSQKLQKDSYLSSAKTPDENVHPNLREKRIKCPPTFVAIISNGRAWADFFTSAIITPDRQVLKDISTGSFTLIASSDKLLPVSYIDGTVAFLSVRGVESYYHWIFDLVSRFELIRAAEIPFHNIDKFVVNSCIDTFQKETLRLLGIPEEKIIESSNFPHIQAKNLIVPSLSGSTRIPKWVCDFLRREFLNYAKFEEEARPKRLYISRKLAVSRRIINEDEVVNFLREYGFETVIFESISFREQISFMAAAEVVVAPHGAGLTNLVFCCPGTKVVEIFSPNYVNGCFWVIANQVDLEYYYLIGDKIPNQQKHPVAEDILVDINALSKIVEFANIEKKYPQFNEIIFRENLRLRNINFILFPDWSQSKKYLYQDLEMVLKVIASNPDKAQITLVIDTTNISEEDADMVLSSIVMNLLMEEDLDVEEGPEISLIGKLSQMQWESLLSCVRGRIVLENENTEAIAKVKADTIPLIQLKNFLHKTSN
ncbi:FkbM family methyltransferase [Okeania sp. SIO2B3]|uniref:FkbM family methyltransferase n=1 Tax=Okeania sp. SIO2B3 TaxID=2607784 RepID=UPI0013C1DE91|nr:FkbM family methyltransferase [Okeania sp. SIO2B3]NET41044.1 FkbM family methyltransferase [Okeania sp. SIO2B3]